MKTILYYSILNEMFRRGRVFRLNYTCRVRGVFVGNVTGNVRCSTGNCALPGTACNQSSLAWSRAIRGERDRERDGAVLALMLVRCGCLHTLEKLVRFMHW